MRTEGDRNGIGFERLAVEAAEFGASISRRASAARRGSEDRVLRVSSAESAAFWTWLAAHEGVQPLRLVDLTAIDGPRSESEGSVDRGQEGSRFEIVYSFQVEPTLQRFRVCVNAEEPHAPDHPPRVESVTRHWPAAVWLEREVFDLFGVDFVGHPDLRRILLGSDFEGAPLRKGNGPGMPGVADVRGTA